MSKIINMFCGLFNGYITVKMKNKILKFELSTPRYSGGGAFEVSTDFEIYDFMQDGKVPSCINQNISLSSADEDWWLNFDHSEENRYKVCGGNHSKIYQEKKEEKYEWQSLKEKFISLERFKKHLEIEKKPISDNVFCVFDYDERLVSFENIDFQGNFARDSFDKLMFQLLKIFYNWYKNPSFKATTNEIYF